MTPEEIEDDERAMAALLEKHRARLGLEALSLRVRSWGDPDFYGHPDASKCFIAATLESLQEQLAKHDPLAEARKALAEAQANVERLQSEKGAGQ